MSPKRIIWNAKSKNQSLSYLGGKPWVNDDSAYPSCTYCSNHMTFFFVIDISEIVEGKLLQLFACTKCITKSTAVPQYPDFGNRIVDSEYARELQTNYRIDILDSLSVSKHSSIDYLPIIKSGISLLTERNTRSRWSRIGGEPPEMFEIAKDKGLEYKFIMQIHERETIHFETKPESPYQAEIDWFGDGRIYLEENYYTLFGGVKIMIYFAHDSNTEAFAVAGR